MIKKFLLDFYCHLSDDMTNDDMIVTNFNCGSKINTIYFKFKIII